MDYNIPHVEPEAGSASAIAQAELTPKISFGGDLELENAFKPPVA